MELYTRTAFAMSELMTTRYSSSFSSASRLFPHKTRLRIYTIYGLVRLADEIVDTYTGRDMLDLLNLLELETYAAMERHYSTNPIVHAFQDTARLCDIDRDLIAPFFESMRTDTSRRSYNQQQYEAYIYGSAEVVGLMCLKVFCLGNQAQYEALEAGAARLGSAYQKINFLRDVAEDHKTLGRLYFPKITFETLDEAAKNSIILDIKKDLEVALPYVRNLPREAKSAVATSYIYYSTLLDKLAHTPITTIKQKRVRLSKLRKLTLLTRTMLRGTV